MIFREAAITDIGQMQIVRNAVKENKLSDPALITDISYEAFLTDRGKGWICEIDNVIAGFSIIDLKENNVWALFVHPDYESKGIGKTLHKLMLDWYFQQTKKTVWLGTAPGTRAENFYRATGWLEVGKHGTTETKFEMTYEVYKNYFKNWP